jgi:hypothetical protein
MTRFLMDDDVVTDTDQAFHTWDEATDWDGRNHISRPSGSQWNHETLYQSRKGRFYLVSSSQWQGTRPSALWLTDQNAARWLVLNDHALPENLAQFMDEVCQ